MGSVPTVSLVDYMAQVAGCTYVSDLHWLDGIGKSRIVRALEKLAPDDYPLREWNDALAYVPRAKPEDTPAAARKRLIDLLSCTARQG